MAITNQRILYITGGEVTFVAKDYRDRAVKKPVTLDGIEFLRRFNMHMLPKRCIKILRFGIYNHTTKRKLDLQFVPHKKPDIDEIVKKSTTPPLQSFTQLTGDHPCLCPVCKIGRIFAIRELPRIRSQA